MLLIPDVLVLPSFDIKVNELIEDVFLVFIDVKNIMFIRTGQIAVSLSHAVQEFTAFIFLCEEFARFYSLSRKEIS